METTPLPRYRLLGVEVNTMTREDLLSAIEQTVQAEGKVAIGHHNMHSVCIVQQDAKMQSFYRLSDYVYVDGMSLVICGRLLGLPLRRRHRVTFLDVIEEFARRACQREWRLFLLGSRPGVADRAAAELMRRHPSLKIATAHGFFDSAQASPDNQAVLAQIQAWQPHVLIVGMGMPRQEHWVVDNLAALNANVTIVLGGILDYLSGDVPIPPRNLGKVGLEWLFRLVLEPRRLWRRYLVEPWCLVLLLLRQLVERLRRTRDKPGPR